MPSNPVILDRLLDLGLPETIVPLAAWTGGAVRVNARLVSGSWGSATVKVRYRNAGAGPLDFSPVRTLGSGTSEVLLRADEIEGVHAIELQTVGSTTGVIAVSVSEDDGDGSGPVVTGSATTTLTGDVTGSGVGSVAATIANSAVTLAKMAAVATATFLGRVTGATGVVEALTGAQATTLLDVFTSSLKGLAPASGGGTDKYLRADATWASPSRLLYNNTASSTTLTNPGAGTETNFDLSYSIPAGFWTVGKTVRVSIVVEAAGGAATTFQFKLKIGSTAIFLSTTGTLTATTQSHFAAEIILTCTATGASGSLTATPTFVKRGSSTLTDVLEAAATVDTTAAGTLQVSGTWNTALATNIGTLRRLLVEALN